MVISSTTASGSDLELGEMVWEELTVGGVYAQCLTPTQVGHGKVVQVPWPTSRLKLGLQFNTSPSPLIPSSQGCRDSTITISEQSRQQQDRNDMEEAAAAQFLSIFKSVLLNRINLVHDISRTDQNMDAKGTLSSTSPVGVLFSGGIDSVFLTAVLHLCLPMQLSIDLINVSFEGPCNESSTQRETPSPDRLAAIAAYGELQVSLSGCFRYKYACVLINALSHFYMNSSACIPRELGGWFMSMLNRTSVINLNKE